MLTLAVLVAGSAFAAGSAAASTFNISPIRAELSAGRRTEALTLTNADDQPVVVQVHVVAWSQQNGEERLDDTRELLVTPPVLQIAAQSEQIVRVALRREPDATRELTYRVIFEEVPQAAPVAFTGLRVALRLSVPVFIAPSKGKALAEVTWQAHSIESGGLTLVAVNHGTGHLQVTDFNVQLPGAAAPLRGTAAKYLLAGSSGVWTLMPDANAVRAAVAVAGPMKIHGRSDQGEFSADVSPSGL